MCLTPFHGSLVSMLLHLSCFCWPHIRVQPRVKFPVVRLHLYQRLRCKSATVHVVSYVPTCTLYSKQTSLVRYSDPSYTCPSTLYYHPIGQVSLSSPCLLLYLSRALRHSTNANTSYHVHPTLIFRLVCVMLKHATRIY